jgi:hypothetical protein
VSVDEDALVERLAQHLDDEIALVSILGPVLTEYANLARKAMWAASQVASNGSAPAPDADFAADWLTAWARFYVDAATASTGGSLEIDKSDPGPDLLLTWHHPAYPLLLRALGRIEGLALLAQPCAWMSAAAGADNVICFRAPGSPAAITRAFASGRHIAAMIDYCYDETAFVMSPFLGLPSRTPVGVLRLASRFGYRVKVLSWAGKRPYIAASIPAAGLAPDRLANEVNEVISREIVADPTSWLLWPSLDRRWTTTEHAPGSP